ncbi:hypothetical protein [Lacisediminimonas sp.]|uniref:hypothetical protein n=1 Tax=Lacisediminimonas sp. TaxID=3060582 RepID=UPI0027178D33|nr:hypothetical protein [Lacisediminimonas sp.]MDO8298161.1 hypothetical protein [Lacisediminimonas sp.]
MSDPVNGHGSSGNIRQLFDAGNSRTESVANATPDKRPAQPVLGARAETKAHALPLPGSVVAVSQMAPTEPVLRPEKGRIGLDLGLRHLEQLLAGINDPAQLQSAGDEDAAAPSPL